MVRLAVGAETEVQGERVEVSVLSALLVLGALPAPHRARALLLHHHLSLRQYVRAMYREVSFVGRFVLFRVSLIKASTILKVSYNTNSITIQC